jgi:DNA-binding XRE family transcriptional regulator
MSNNSAFGSNLRRYREMARLTREGLAADVQVTAATVKAWESGRIRQPREQTVRDIEEALGVPRGRLGETPLTCSAWFVPEDRVCGATPVYPFRARCACGHLMAGLACGACAGSLRPACLTCWQEAGHRCETSVTIGSAEAATAGLRAAAS